ncbi:sigma-54-dependent Fis family transcriptional regulator [Capillimicrobium parvum]|uniref:sigma-54-dependent Fis family transcriptional regulator n=1 Tax=Capillimicrobium parvum TaxID=2884022 RepID=UPI00216ADD73|nr:helix-turn-helix domain-containing protein [Capillimicrobium parvum]
MEADEVRSAKEVLISNGLMHAEWNSEWLPGEIDRSWRRSITAGATRKPGSFHYVNEFDADSELSRAARPILDRLEGMLQDLGTSIFLADRTGQIVARRVAGRSERARFDNACAAEGFDFSEESIGTNGLGTAIQEAGAVFVRGPEHFNDALEDLACAGAGIRHPATGRMVGSLSLAAPADAAETMMLALVREGARQIVDNLSLTVGRRELALGRSYQRHRDKGPVIVLNSDTVMSNVTGLSFLNVESHGRLWELLLSQDWSHGPCVLDLDLQALQTRVLAHRLDDVGEEPAFAVEILNRRRPPGTRPRGAVPTFHDPFVAQLQRAAGRSARAVSVTGPSGSGKLHVALEWLRSVGHPEPLVLDAGDLENRPSWRGDALAALEAKGAVVLRRLEDLPVNQVNAVKALSAGAARAAPDDSSAPTVDSGHGESPARLVITADLGRCTDSTVGALVQVTPGVELPPLSSRGRDIPKLVDTLLERDAPSRRPVLSAATLQVLLRWHWPGNVAELRCLLEDLARELPGQSVSPYHLPECMWDAAHRRTFTRIQLAERAEIVAALRQTNGNRSKAASLLGIGRTTLYRKLRGLGIEEDALLPASEQPAER